MTSLDSKREKLDEILEILSEISLPDTLEILANVFIIEGLTAMSTDKPVSQDNVMDFIYDDIKENKATMENSTALMGLELLEALNKM